MTSLPAAALVPHASALKTLAANAPVLNVSGLTQLLLAVLVIGVLLAAVSMLLRAHKRDTAAVIGMVAIVLIGVLIAGLATGNNVQTLGGDLFHLIFKI